MRDEEKIDEKLIESFFTISDFPDPSEGFPSPQDDKIVYGCWYCKKDDMNLRFSEEFDTPVHIECIKARVASHPEDREAAIMHKELCE